MPMRVGFVEFRKDMLNRELESIQEMLPTLGVEKVILTGDMVTGKFRPDSSIDLIFVQKTDATFGRRADFFSYHLGSFVAVNTQVYTPEEFQALETELPALRDACQKGRVIYDA